jgi:hypothetical protein
VIKRAALTAGGLFVLASSREGSFVVFLPLCSVSTDFLIADMRCECDHANHVHLSRLLHELHTSFISLCCVLLS